MGRSNVAPTSRRKRRRRRKVRGLLDAGVGDLQREMQCSMYGWAATMSPTPTPPDPSPRHLTQGLPPASHPGHWEMLASSCPKGREQPAVERVEVIFNVAFTLLPQTYRVGLISPPFLALPPSPRPHMDLEYLQV